MNDVSTIVRNHVEESALLKEGEKMHDKSFLKKDLGFSSLQLVMLFTKLSMELKLNIMELTDQDLVTVETVEDLIILFTKKTNNV